MEMNYRVIWPAETLNELADAWLVASDQKSLAAASHRLEPALTQNLTRSASRGMPL
jgi:hypothetical protein